MSDRIGQDHKTDIFGASMVGGDLLNTCVEHLKAISPVRKVKVRRNPGIRRDGLFEAVVEVETEKGSCGLWITTKGVLKRPIAEHLFVLLKNAAKPVLVMSEYVNPSIAAELIKNKINFIDRSGNMFLNLAGILYIEKTGRRPVLLAIPRLPSVFQPKGMQLLFVLLTHPDTINQTVRCIADQAGISKDRVSIGLKDLLEKGYLLKTGGNMYRFADKKALLEQWIANYADRLQPTLVLGRYKILPSLINNIPDLLKTAFAQNPGAYAIGGSLGADLLVPYYRGYTTELFVKPENADRLKKALRLVPAKEPDVTLMRLFSSWAVYEKGGTAYSVAHPLLIYAELLSRSGHGSREQETAHIVYNTFLKQDFE